MNPILEDRLSRFLAEAHLKQGAGKGANGTIDVCIVQATDWLTGGKGVTDSPSCVDVVIRRFAISLNDSMRFSAFRDELKPYAARIANTNQGDAIAWKRSFMCADWAVRHLAPLTMDALAEIAPKKAQQYRHWAAKYRTIAPITDKASAQAGYEVAHEVRTAANTGDVAYVAYAAHVAYDAYAKDAAADYAFEVSDVYAAYFAYAADVADAKSADFTRLMWTESLAFLDRLIDAKLDALPSPDATTHEREAIWAAAAEFGELDEDAK